MLLDDAVYVVRSLIRHSLLQMKSLIYKSIKTVKFVIGRISS